MKKKFIILGILAIIILICINLLYGFFYEDNIKNIMDKILFRTKYHSREIIDKQVLYGNFEKDSMITKNNISLKLSSINYEETSGILNADFELSSTEPNFLEEICYIMKINDKQNIFYNKRVGEKLYVDNLDYLLFNHDLYNKLSSKNLKTDKSENTTNLITLSKLNNNTTNIKILLYLEKNYKVQESLSFEFFDLIYKPESNNSHKVFDSFGSFRFIINF